MNTKTIKYPNNKLKEIRLKRDLLQREVARQLDLQFTDRLCRWEKGFSIPSVPNLFKLAQLYQVLPHELYPGLATSAEKSQTHQPENSDIE